MKKFLIAALLLLTACSDKVTINHNGDRVSDLERRMALNEQLDYTQSELIALNDEKINALDVRVSALESRTDQLESDLAAEIAARSASDAELAQLIADEAAAREAGDDELATDLANAIAAQQSVNNTVNSKINLINALLAVQAVIDVSLQFQINNINSKFPTINAKLNSLQNQVNNLDSRLASVEADVAALTLQVNSLSADVAYVTSEVNNLYTITGDLEDRIAALEATDPVPGPQGPPGTPGPMGPQGPQGPPGVSGGGVSVTTISLSNSPSCKPVGVNGWYAKRDGETVKLYGNLDDCEDNDDRIATIDPTPQTGGYAAYWLTSTKLAFADGSSSANLKILNF